MRTRWTLGLAMAAILAVIGAAVGYSFGFSQTFTSTAILSLSPRDTAVGADNLTLAAARYQAFLASDRAASAAARRDLGTTAQLREATKVSVRPQTVTIEVAVTLTNAAKAATVANRLADAAVQRGRDDDLVSVELVVPGVRALQATAPNRRLAAIGAGAGVVAIVIGAAVVIRLQRRATPASHTTS